MSDASTSSSSFRVLPKQAIDLPRSRQDCRVVAAQRRVYEVLVNPENDEKSETEKAALAGLAPRTWRKRRTAEVVNMALAARRATHAQHLPEIDQALIKKAKEGSLPHVLVAYERIEGWRPGLILSGDTREKAQTEVYRAISEADKRAISDIPAKALLQRHERRIQDLGTPQTRGSAQIRVLLEDASDR